MESLEIMDKLSSTLLQQMRDRFGPVTANCDRVLLGE
jgi:hypothetical protein